MKPLVLVVEDSKKIADGMRSSLQNVGVTTLVAHNYDQATMKLRTRPEFDAVVSDIMIPTDAYTTDETDAGTDFVELVRDENKDIPVFVYSGHLSEADLQSLSESNPSVTYTMRTRLEADEVFRQSFFSQVHGAAAQYQAAKAVEAKAALQSADTSIIPLKLAVDEVSEDVAQGVVDGSYGLEFLTNSDFEDVLPQAAAIRGLKISLPFWLVKRSESLFSAELYRANSIKALGRSEINARENLARLLSEALLHLTGQVSEFSEGSTLSEEKLEYLLNYLMVQNEREPDN